jgi:hypothetical protein
MGMTCLYLNLTPVINEDENGLLKKKQAMLSFIVHHQSHLSEIFQQFPIF